MARPRRGPRDSSTRPRTSAPLVSPRRMSTFGSSASSRGGGRVLADARDGAGRRIRGPPPRALLLLDPSRDPRCDPAVDRRRRRHAHADAQIDELARSTGVSRPTPSARQRPPTRPPDLHPSRRRPPPRLLPLPGARVTISTPPRPSVPTTRSPFATTPATPPRATRTAPR